MNCSQCQERLDERLDELRSGLHGGTLSPENAREAAHRALDETIPDCPDCARELRAHFHVRLALMLPVAETITVPPALRANVRRVLERENGRVSSSSARRPFAGYAWTGGAMLSALVLFVVARPYLAEHANSSSSSGAPASDAVGAVAPPVAQKPSLSQSKSGAPASSSKAPGSAAKPSAPNSVSPRAKSPAMPAPLAPVTEQNPAPSSVVTPRGAPRPAEPRQRPAEGEGGRPPVASSGVLGRSSKTSSTGSATATSRVQAGKSGAATPEKEMFAPSGQALGLTLRFVPSSSASVGATQPRASLFRPPADGASPPAPVPAPAPADGQEAPPSERANDSMAGSRTRMTPARPKQSPPLPVFGRSGAGDAKRGEAPAQGAARSDSDHNATSSAPATTTTGMVSVVVEHDVNGARIHGQVQNKKAEPVLLWTGNAVAGQPISVQLAKLSATSGDTVNIAIEQQSASGRTKVLATSSLLVP